MEYTEPIGTPEENDAIIVKADEVDESGADISTISPTDASESDFNERIEFRRAQDAQPSGSPKILANAVSNAPRPLSRPVLRREGSAAAPPQTPPPLAPPQQQQREEPSNPTDSLTLLQLKRLVTDLPKIEPTAYAYEYEETRSFPEELEEWFQYTKEDRYMLLRAKQTFVEKWEESQAKRPESSDDTLEWTDVVLEDRENFTKGVIQALDHTELSSRVKSIECVSYIALGIWGNTAGLNAQHEGPSLVASDAKWLETQSTELKLQLIWIGNGVRMLCKNSALGKLVAVLKKLWESEQDVDMTSDTQDEKLLSTRLLKQIEVNQTLTALYLLVEASRWQDCKQKNLALSYGVEDAEPDLLQLLAQIIAKRRWVDESYIPLSRILLLFWKTSLSLFGNFQHLRESKAALREASDVDKNEADEAFITASPLDYHLFRQEITSKYPAYSPPQPLVPIELENNSILPPLPNHPSRQVSQENLQIIAGQSGTRGSIFNQPVHIATPAPSPPPSPAGPGGKGGKKQNYQTNQNFPFLYPPLDDTAITVGGKANAEFQAQLVGKRWEGGDVPVSILEAGELFADRMRMTRSIRQLWDVRENYIKCERGWNDSTDGEDEASDQEGSESSSENLEDSNKSEQARIGSRDHGPARGPSTEDVLVQRRLDAVDNFYRTALPSLQSLISVLWKELFANVTALISNNSAVSGQNGVPNEISFPEDGTNEASGRSKTNLSSYANINELTNGSLAETEECTDPAVEGLNRVRIGEISSKAVSGTLLILLKWFKLSHILKFEYLTQLLLDANYLPLILKYLAHQDIDKAFEQKNDREDLNFFYFCHLNSKNPPTSPPQPALSSSTSSEDEAAPPPIGKHRRSPTSQSPPPETPPPAPTRPEVDELGYPTTGQLPQTPLTNYAPRFFLTNINLLRILQKITKRKAHRALLLVQYKSSTILRKALKIPQPDLRLYTLKLFKSQVPYCGRKWRQTNMRVITAIYLHCRPELRDEWLCGGDVDGVVEEAVPLEQAGRSLVHWWHLREFWGVMKGDAGGRREEDGFFKRELEKMGWGLGGLGLGEEEGEGDGEGMGDEGEGGPLQLEGWA